jgi:hypothetical protein
MAVLHIAPSDSAGGSLRQAVRAAGRDDEVLSFRDDLSCGPIASDDPSVRAIWWGQFCDPSEVEADLRNFWHRFETACERLVLWFSRHAARELAFFLACVERLGDRPYDVVDVTGRQFPFERQDGSAGLFRPAEAVSLLRADALKSLFGEEQSIPCTQRDACRRAWSQLKLENAPFRIVTEAGLASVPVDYFDRWLLGQATSAWQRVLGVVANTMVAEDFEPYIQVYDVMLRARIAALVDAGKLITDGDPWDISCRIRLP